MTAQQAADAFGVSRQTVNLICRNGPEAPRRG
jgi:DNA-binding XRE family transcriptional regulator